MIHTVSRTLLLVIKHGFFALSRSKTTVISEDSNITESKKVHQAPKQHQIIVIFFFTLKVKSIKNLSRWPDSLWKILLTLSQFWLKTLFCSHKEREKCPQMWTCLQILGSASDYLLFVVHQFSISMKIIVPTLLLSWPLWHFLVTKMKIKLKGKRSKKGRDKFEESRVMKG